MSLTLAYPILLDDKIEKNSKLLKRLNLSCKTLHPFAFSQYSIHDVAASGQTDLVDIICSPCCFTDDVSERGLTSLHVACIKGHIDIVMMLVHQYGADISAQDIHGRTALHMACWYGHTELVEKLVNSFHMDPMLLDNNGCICLHHAAHGGKESIVKLLITRCKCPVDYRNNDGQTPLHLACAVGDRNVSVVRMLASVYKADMTALDKMNEAPIHNIIAASNGHAEIVRILINHGCPADFKDGKKQTALHLACRNAHADVVGVVLTKHKADLTVRDERNNTPLDIAIRYYEVVRCLITYCDLNINAKYVLHFACHQGYAGIVDILLQRQIDLNLLSLDNNGNTPLHIATQYGHKAVMIMLLDKYGCPVDQRNNKSETPLHLACSKGHLGFIGKFVKQHKADLTAHDENNDTPLHTAALCGQAGVVYCLIEELHCDPTITGFKGRNILHHACLRNHDMLARLLIDTYQLSIISADDDGNTPLHLAAMFGQNKCVHMLLNHVNAPVFVRNTSGKSVLDVASEQKTTRIIKTYIRQEDNKAKLQYDYKQLQDLSTKKYSGAQRLTRIFVMGNVESGKSTLVESIKREGFLSSFNQVSEATVPPHT